MTTTAEDHLGNQVEILTDEEKRALLVQILYSSGRRTFIETGSYRGETISAVLPFVDDVRSVELDDANFHYCTDKFRSDGRVKLWHGDSARHLATMLYDAAPALIWLDAHKSGPDSSGSHEENPLRAELLLIFSQPVDHIVFVDDARFMGRDGWPTLHEIRDMAGDREVKMYSDIVRINHRWWDGV